MIAAGALLLLGTFYSQQINALFALPLDGALQFVKLALFWSAIFGAAGVFLAVVGLIQRSSAADRFSLVPTLTMVIILLAVFATLFYRALSTATPEQPIRPGETLLI
jgi:hypothetical protein